MTDPTTTLPAAATVYDLVTRSDSPRVWIIVLLASLTLPTVYMIRRGIHVHVHRVDDDPDE